MRFFGRKKKKEKVHVFAPRRVLRFIRIFAVIFIAYLIQVCVMPYVKISGVSPNIAITVTAIITVCFGKEYALWSGCSFGIMTEVMTPARPLFNLLVYPIAAILCAVVFSDKNPRQLEYERALGKAGRNRSPYLRTILCSIANSLMFETVNIVYVYLRDGVWDAPHVQRALLVVLSTALITAVLMLPLRRLFGFRRAPKKKKGQRLYSPAS